MKTRTLLIIAVLMLAGLATQAQVSGNIKLVDIHRQLMNDHSGIMVVFTASGPPGVTDTAYTDSLGNYSKTLVPGTYVVSYSKTGFVKKTFQSFLIPAAPYVHDSDRLYQDYPVVYLSTPVSGTLQPFTHYLNHLPLPSMDTVRAGDTLTVPAGCWLDMDLVVYGVLRVQGTPSEKAIVFTFDRNSLGYLPFRDSITALPGSKLIFDNAYVAAEINATGADVEVTNCSSIGKAWHEYGIVDTTNMWWGFHGIHFALDNSTLTLSDCNQYGFIDANNFSTSHISCTNFASDIAQITLNTASTADITSSNLGGHSANALIDCEDCGGLTVQDNYVYGSRIKVRNVQPGTIDVSLINNSFDVYNAGQGISTDIFGNVRAHIINNFGINFITDNTLQPATFVDFKYNVLIGTFYPDTAILPIGLPINFGSYPYPDTTDLYHNFYAFSTVDFYSTFPNLRAGTDTLIHDMGDPTLFDPDGSRSDVGARRDTVACNNPTIPYPTGGGTFVTLNDSVWPGDANYDGLCDNTDLLPIGVKYGATGPVRPSASLVWTAQYCDPWGDSLANHRDIKHVDCNGDGTINYTDVNAIYQNYSLTHVVHKQQQQQFGNGLWLQFPSDSIFEGDTVEVKVMLGTTSQPVNNIYGLAFSISYDSAFIKPGSATMKFDPCWLGTDTTNMVSFFKELPNQTKYDLALCRTDHAAVSGGGQIGTLVVVINDDIQAKDSMTLTTQMDFSNILAIDQHENRLNLGSDPNGFNVLVGYAHSTGIVADLTSTFDLAIYPNPAKTELHIAVSGNKSEVQYGLYDLQGKSVASGTLTGNETTVNVANLSNGLYLLRCQTNGGVVYRKVMINK